MMSKLEVGKRLVPNQYVPKTHSSFVSDVILSNIQRSQLRIYFQYFCKGFGTNLIDIRESFTFNTS